MASLIVLAPVFLILMRVIRRNIAVDPSRKEIWVRRWALFLTVFLAGATIVVDLIVLLTQFLRGEEITVAFLLKVLVILLVAGAGFLHFLADLRGYWEKNDDKARYVTYGVGVLVFVAIASGFFIVGTPQQARLMRFDEQKVSDLQTIQWQLVNYWQTKQTLPATLTETNDPLSGFVVPSDPQTGEPYEYQRTSNISFELCAMFNAKDRYARVYPERPITPVPNVAKAGGDTWEHGEGRVCFERTIDPERYPPINR
jgi:hypothetical protein